LAVRKPKERPKKDQRRIKEGPKNSQMPAAGATHFVSLIAFKRAVVDLHIALINSNSSALEVACPPPGIGAKI
jgi:hypothetical protein